MVQGIWSGQSGDVHGCQQIRVVAITKARPVSLIRQVTEMGSRCLGKNYAQEVKEKAPQFSKDIEWDFLGNL
uniref:Alanine racemase N-terminal domain-containing protein n=1 Tax=Populus trichocarpa TaxID=3694 RepID=A0A2K1XG53_POPTR